MADSFRCIISDRFYNGGDDMDTVKMNFTKDWQFIGYSANYKNCGKDISAAAMQMQATTDKPFVNLGRRTVHERAVEALKGYSASNARQGYMTREQAEYGKKVKPFVVKERKKSLFEKVLDFFTYEVYEDE